MSNLVMWNLIVGFLMPNVVAVLQQPKFTSQVRAGIMLAVALVGGAGTAYFNDLFNFGDVVGSILIVGVSAITFYKGFWKPTGVAVAIENATSKTPPTVQQAHPDDAPTDGNLGTYDRNEYGRTDILYVALVVLVVVAIVVLLF